MKKAVLVVCSVLLMASGINAIGLQHGLFRSQSTQGDPWQGTAEIIKEHYDITVFSDYLDVELTWEFKAGGTAPGQYQDALEIVGNLNLVANSVVVSMITWYKDMILKGKLKTNDVAREQYENVVQRSSDAPPPPRDPVLLEYIRNDNYDISIFPVEFGKTRQVRIRYLIPAFEVNGVNKISYPHAFTDKATVSVKVGGGVQGYHIETAVELVPYYEVKPVSLSRDKFEFMPYRRTAQGKESIEYIVPQLANEPSGSVIYSGSLSTESMSGEVSHVITMSADQALLKTAIPQDFVILWRWNHPEVLSRYAGQIVRQSKQLIRFLNALGESGKRAALIVSFQGEGRVTFELDSPGSENFGKMLKWLEEISKREVIEPPLTNGAVKSEIDFDLEQAAREFNEALQAALDLFDKESGALKQLIVITAGPRLVANYRPIPFDVKMDTSIAIKCISTYQEHGSTAPVNQPGDRLENLYWPGIDIPNFLRNNGAPIRVTATVGNGKDTYTFQVSPEQGRITTQAHLYSKQNLTKEIRWRVEQGGDVEEFVEIPAVVMLEDGLQYGRLIGASKYLNPLADLMPSSIASSLGFIDKKYSLVALEEDALPREVAEQYNISGVPLLEPQDIFAASTETSSLPVADWLKANPPQSLARYQGGIYYGEPVSGGWVLEAADMAAPVTSVKFSTRSPDGNVSVRVAMPAVNPVYAEAVNPEYDYKSSVKPAASAGVQKQLKLVAGHGRVEIDLCGLGVKELDGISIIIYNLNGQVLKIIKLSSLDTGRKVILSGKNMGFSSGAYIVRIQGRGINMSSRVVLR